MMRGLLGLVMVMGLTCASAAERFSRTDITQPDFFPIMPWDPLHGWDGKARECETNGLESISECGFNFAGFVVPGDLAKCRKLGLGAIALPTGNDVLPLKYQHEWRTLSDEEIDRRVRALVKGSASSAALKGYFIMDEPGAVDFPALGKVVAAVKKYAPGKLAYINLFPDYATLGAPDRSQLGTSNYTEYLERFVTEVKPQLLSYDNYMVQYSDDLLKADVAMSYFRNLVEVRRVGKKYGLPCVQIVAANQLRPRHTIPSPGNLSLQAYTTLAAGFRGVTWYTYYGRGYRHSAVGLDGKRTITWAYLREINRQIAKLAPVLCRLASTGIYFSSPAPAAELPALPGKLVREISSTRPMMVGEFEGPKAEKYVMVVNLSLEHSANYKVVFTSAAVKVEEIAAIDGLERSFEAGKDGFWLAPGQGVLLRVRE